jgi:hypothetical protein
VVVAVIFVGMVKSALHEVVDVITMWNRFVSAPVAVGVCGIAAD